MASLSPLYTLLSYLSWPALKVMSYARLQKGKELPHRVQERFGIASAQRPSDKKIIWIHAASNGEALSAIPLIDYFQHIENPPHILITTMTVTSSQLLKQRTSPDNVTHQFIPYDHPYWVKKFIKYWSPDMVIWTESELWPNHLSEIKKREIPSVLVNARLSQTSCRNWSKFKDSFHDITNAFDIILAQTDKDKSNLESLGLSHVENHGNLKDMAPALPFDNAMAQDLRPIIDMRPTLLFASTHAPEEDIAINTHKSISQSIPNLLSIIIPRHPNRGDDITKTATEKGFRVAQRSLKMSPKTDTDIYIADTLGEMGLFYHLCPIVFVGNSMGTTPGGGHNLLEPAWHNCAIITGDDLHNFSIQAKEMPESNACQIVSSEQGLIDALSLCLNDKPHSQTTAQNAYDYVAKKHDQGINDIIKAIKPTCQKAGIL